MASPLSSQETLPPVARSRPRPAKSRAAYALGLASPLAALALGMALVPPVQAGPVVCTTTLEAPPSDPTLGGTPPAPVEVTRCNAVQTVPDLVERRYYSYTAPYARGVSLTNQITELFGIAMGGGDGTRVMGFGYSDQAIVWDGSAIGNTSRYLQDQQSDPMPWRTSDVSNGFTGNLGNEQVALTAWQDPAPSNWSAPVRGLW